MLVILTIPVSMRACFDLKKKVNSLYYDLDTMAKKAELIFHKSYLEFNVRKTIPEIITFNGKTYTMTSIESSAFYGCSNLEKIICRAKTLPSLESDAFAGDILYYTNLYVPLSVVDEYSHTLPWKRFFFVLPIEPSTVVTIGNYFREYGEDNPIFDYTVESVPRCRKRRGYANHYPYTANHHPQQLYDT
jgi:hypothetical protein